MEQQQQQQQGPTFSLTERPDLERVVAWMRGLLENDMAREAAARFVKLRPPDQADVLAELPREAQAQFLGWLTAQSLGTIIDELEPSDAVELSREMEPGRLSQVLDETSPDAAADVLRGLPEDVVTATLEGMEAAADVAPLLVYEDDDAGGLMTPELIALRDDMTVAQAMTFVRSRAPDLDPEDVTQLFALDRDGILTGGISLAALVLARDYQRVSLLMEPDPISVQVETDREQCARLMERYELRNLPVVGDDGTLVGVLKLEDMVDVVEDEATEDMYRMIGVDEGEKALGPFWGSVRNRLPWLCVNLGTVMLAGLVITLFQSTLTRAVALVILVPVITGQGGIAGTQTLTLMVRSLALREISPANTWRLLTKETRLGLVHGLVLGVITGGIILLWKGSEYLALVAAVAMLANLVVAGMAGVLVPLALKAVRVDPALASAVAVTTMTDVIGLLIYLGFASLTIGLISGGL